MTRSPDRAPSSHHEPRYRVSRRSVTADAPAPASLSPDAASLAASGGPAPFNQPSPFAGMGRRASLGLGIGAFAAVAAHELHAVKRAALRFQAEPDSRPRSTELRRYTFVAPPAENSSTASFVGEADVEVELYELETIGGVADGALWEFTGRRVHRTTRIT